MAVLHASVGACFLADRLCVANACYFIVIMAGCGALVGRICVCVCVCLCMCVHSRVDRSVYEQQVWCVLIIVV